ncbi:MAG TPA: DUF4249 family protein, partial [Longimicrobiaceae bacterium]|nr:DUF4249 family protein [Longimicrobiaceae bacterium]
MEILRTLPLLLCVLLTAGCGFQREPTPIELTGEQLMVHSMLEAGSDTVSVLLTRLDPRTLFINQGSQPLSGANVRIFSGGDTVRLAEAPAGFPSCVREIESGWSNPSATAGPGCYAAIIPAGIRGGRSYGLLVTLPGGVQIRGEAAVPEAVAMLRPVPGTHVEIPAPRRSRPQEPVHLPVKWDGGDPASWSGWVSLGLRQVGIYRDGERLTEGTCALPELGNFLRAEVADSISVPIPYAFCSAGSGAAQREIPWD